MRGISWLAENRSASEEGLLHGMRSMQCVYLDTIRIFLSTFWFSLHSELTCLSFCTCLDGGHLPLLNPFVNSPFIRFPNLPIPVYTSAITSYRSETSGWRGQNSARHHLKSICCCKLHSLSWRQYPFVFWPAVPRNVRPVQAASRRPTTNIPTGALCYSAGQQGRKFSFRPH